MAVRTRPLAVCLVVTAVVAVGACGAVPPPAPIASSTQPLASLIVRGGLCASTVCRSEVQVAHSGHWTRTGGGAVPTPGRGASSEGQLAPAALGALRSAVERTTLEQAAVNTGVCATASDGMELLISWASADRILEVSSCERVVPVTDPLVVALEALLYAQAE